MSSRGPAVTKFLDKLNQQDNKEDFIKAYLTDKSNGNTHPHSFRTMLLAELLYPGKGADRLKEVSTNFNKKLGSLWPAMQLETERTLLRAMS